jgi:chromosome segregation ATPase
MLLKRKEAKMLNVMGSFKGSQMSAKLQRLHKIYGPFVRFDGEGTEGNNPDAVQKAIEEAERAETEKFDKVRQQADQEKANAARSREQAQASEAKFESANSENESLKQQLADAESKLADKDLNIEEIDVEQSSDPAMAQVVNDLRSALAKSNDAINKLGKAKDKFESDDRDARKKNQADNAKTAAYNELLKDLDEDYGSDVRNAAVKEFQELAKTGKVPSGSPARAARVMEKCYKNAVKAKGGKKTTIASDNGSGGGFTGLEGHEIKAGSLDEVYDQMNSALK